MYGKPLRTEQVLPTAACADMCRSLVQPLRFFLSGQPREFPMVWMVRSDKRLLPVENRWVQRSGVVPYAHAEGLEMDRHGRRQCRMGGGIEVGIGQIRNLRLARVEFDEVRAVHVPDVSTCAAFVETKQRRQALYGAFVNVDGRRSELSDRGTSRSSRHPVYIANSQQRYVSFFACPTIRREHRTDVPPYGKRKLPERRSPVEPQEREEDEKIFPSGSDDSSPLSGIVSALHKSKRSSQAPETLPDCGAARKFFFIRGSTSHFEELDEGPQQLLVTFDGEVGRRDEFVASAPVSTRNERHTIRYVAKDVEDTRPGCHCGFGKLIFDPVLEFPLLVEFLKRRNRSHEAVPEWRKRTNPGRFRPETSRHDQDAFRVRPRMPEALRTLLGILDYVDNVSDIHNLRRRWCTVSHMLGIPSGSLDTAETEIANVITSTAAEVKDRGSGVNQAIDHCNPDRPRVVRPRDGSLVSILRKQSREFFGIIRWFHGPSGDLRAVVTGTPRGACSTAHCTSHIRHYWRNGAGSATRLLFLTRSTEASSPSASHGLLPPRPRRPVPTADQQLPGFTRRSTDQLLPISDRTWQSCRALVDAARLTPPLLGNNTPRSARFTSQPSGGSQAILSMANSGKPPALRWRSKHVSDSNSGVPASSGVYVIGHCHSLYGLELSRVYVYVGETMNLRRRLDEHLPQTEENPDLKAYLRINYTIAVCWYAPTEASRRKAVQDELIRELQPRFNTLGLLAKARRSKL